MYACHTLAIHFASFELFGQQWIAIKASQSDILWFTIVCLLCEVEILDAILVWDK